MRRNTRKAGSLVLLAALSCGDVDNFDIVESSSTQIPGCTVACQVLSTLPFADFGAMDLTQNEELENQGVSKDQIDSVKVTDLVLTVTDPPGQDLTFIETIEFRVSAAGLSEKVIAQGGPFPAGLTQVHLNVLDVELKPYASAESMTITTETGPGSEMPPQSTTVEATITLSVDVNVSGVLGCD
ncbi:MAG: hypothetical protein HYZ27_05585 [Deltaproteobacteria bacterium]|nr:hypothetical protein [Deltaproteobacteria bacterium]